MMITMLKNMMLVCPVGRSGRSGAARARGSLIVDGTLDAVGTSASSSPSPRPLSSEFAVAVQVADATVDNLRSSASGRCPPRGARASEGACSSVNLAVSLCAASTIPSQVASRAGRNQ
jgi:hypothetical protein